jgi:RNA polymerase sigma-70 factor, ECF subfamily
VFCDLGLKREVAIGKPPLMSLIGDFLYYFNLFFWRDACFVIWASEVMGREANPSMSNDVYTSIFLYSTKIILRSGEAEFRADRTRRYSMQQDLGFAVNPASRIFWKYNLPACRTFIIPVRSLCIMMSQKAGICITCLWTAIMTAADKDLLEHTIFCRTKTAKKQDPAAEKNPVVPFSNESVSSSETEASQIEIEIIELLRSQAAALSRYAGTVTRDRAIVQDGIQEAFLRYFVARVDGQHVENPRAWLFRVLRNYILDCKRKENSMPAVGLESAGEVVDLRQDLEKGYQQNESFRRAFSLLSPREQECMQLRLEGFGYEEIAEILRIRSGTVAALLARALKKIRGSGILEGRPE